MDNADLALGVLLGGCIGLAGIAFLFPETFYGLTLDGTVYLQGLRVAAAHMLHFVFDNLRSMISILFG